MADALYLPEDIVHLIFLRLPRKPLFRLKCLSKHWNRLISEHFIKLRSRRMMFLPSLPFHAIDNTATSEDMTPSKMIKLSSPSINTGSYKEVTIVGSFNGIVLLVLEYLNTIVIDPNSPYGHHMILYNPLSGEFNTVPRGGSYKSYNYYVYGFGYGTAADDLKIIRLKYLRFGSNYESKSFEVFSLKTWSWSRPSKLTDDSCFCDSYSSGIFANGFLYWNATRNSGSPLYLIVTLNIKTMEFSRIEIPDRYWMHRLGTYKGRLCMICSQNNVEGYELRVMNKPWLCSSELWSTVCSFPSSLLHIDFASDLGTLCILDDGRLLTLKSCNQLIIYDMLKDSYMEVDNLTSFIRVGKLQSVEYIQSSISPSDICSVFI
ncbi:putative F-box domain, galactose oxidase/kelch, beta-propeller, F-box associated interaction [Helianthus annuus]|nr:F-box/kelch-repeat protein At3g06240 [Helianthus annuus]KAJ0584666.1 putative F-box domain, galactose oxidase/kelch, beta-propeller, F-box associated interaction [Helianthus annuus]KAJ0750333.1 putative F-box domain, galactose oxidase/kelch, beta-propeller, F-box associated interaction [Helianthus annuus]KAJ0919067.1 putative F-box domain, galactose oxidase/kelch, beta-propeller, F-box associated interaction [Helianthus annuus]